MASFLEMLCGYESIPFEEGLVRIDFIKKVENIPVKDDQNFIQIIDNLKKSGIISGIEEVAYLVDVNTEQSHRLEGHARNALNSFRSHINSIGYKYLIANAVTSDGRGFCKSYGFDDLGNDFYGLKTE